MVGGHPLLELDVNDVVVVIAVPTGQIANFKAKIWFAWRASYRRKQRCLGLRVNKAARQNSQTHRG